MSSQADLSTATPVRPRPAVLKTLGICNIVFSVLSMLCILSSAIWILVAFSITLPKAELRAESKASAPVAKTGGGVPMVAAFNPMMGMDDPKFLGFCIAENGVGLMTNILMFATGVGLVNRRRWAAVGWARLSWAKMGLAVLAWGYFIVAVSPGFSERMARSVVAMFEQQAIPAAKVPSVAEMTTVYSITNLIMALTLIVVSSIYPAISIWMLGRPGVKAAILAPVSTSPEVGLS